MAIFQHRDGELRLYSGVTPGNGYETAGSTNRIYAEMLFVNAGMTGPVKRPTVSENIVMDRGVWTADAEYRAGMDEEKLAPLPISFTFKTVDDVTTRRFIDLLTGVSPLTLLGRRIRSSKGSSTISGITLPQFADTTKMAYDVETLWDGTSDLGFRWAESHFHEITVTEAEEEVTITANGNVYGQVTRIAAFRSGNTLHSGYATGA